MLILTIVFFAGLTLFHLLELVAPVHTKYHPGIWRRGYVADAIAVVVNGPALSALTKLACAAIVMRAPHVRDLIGDWSWWAQFGLFFIVNDFMRYWLHRWYHDSNFLWRFHRVHHAIVEMDAMSVFRLHVLEAVIKNGVIFLPFQLIGLDPTVIVAYSSLDILKGYWHHANLRSYIGRLNYFLNSAELHWWHHSVEARGQNSNFGSVLSIWDWMFGTAFWPRGEWPAEIGVKGMDQFPDGYLGQLVSPVYDDEAMQHLCEAHPSCHHTPPHPRAARTSTAPASTASHSARGDASSVL